MKKRPYYASKEDFEFRLLQLMKLLQGFHVQDISAIRYINSGMLGFQTTRRGELLRDDNNKPKPITISQKTFYKYKPMTKDTNVALDSIAEFSMQGYPIMLDTHREIATHLMELSFDNLIHLTADKILERQKIIDSIASKIVPLNLAIGDLIKNLKDRNMISPVDARPSLTQTENST